MTWSPTSAAPPLSTKLRQVGPPREPGGICGGVRFGWHTAGCGARLVYQSTSRGIEYWSCPACGNPHWWPVKKGI